MKDQNNFYPIEGVVYAKPVRVVEGKKGTKNEGKTFEFASIILEVKREYKDKSYVELPEFELGKGVNLDEFIIGDRVTVFFALSGKKISDTFHKTSAKANYIKHSDMYDKKEVGGKVPSDYAKRETVFIPPNPMEDDGNNEDDLPF
jgi:hypothetical protein